MVCTRMRDVCCVMEVRLKRCATMYKVVANEVQWEGK